MRMKTLGCDYWYYDINKSPIKSGTMTNALHTLSHLILKTKI